MKKIVIVFIFLFSFLFADNQPEIINLQKKLGSTKGKDRVELLFKLSKLHLNYSSEKSINYAEEAYQYALENNMTDDLPKVAIFTATVCLKLEELDKGLEYALKAKRIIPEDDHRRLGDVYNLLGNVYYRDTKYESAIEYYKLAESEYEIAGFSNGRLNTLVNIASILISKQDYQTAIDMLEDVDNTASNIIEPRLYAKVLNNLAIAYKSLNMNKKAIETYEKSYRIKEKENDFLSMTTTLINIGNFFWKLHRYEQAESRYLKALKICDEVGILRPKDNILLALARLYENNKDYEKAFQAQRRYSVVYDSLMTEERIEKVSEMQAKLDFERTEKEVEVLKLQNTKSELELKIKNYLVFIALIVLGSMIIIVLVIRIKYNEKEKLNQILEKKNKDLIISNKKLKESELNLKRANHAKTKLFSIIGHDLKSPFTSLLAFADILSMNYEHMSDEEKLKLINTYRDAGYQILDLLENLLTWSRTQTGEITYNEQNLSLFDLSLEAVNLLEQTAMAKDVKIENRVSKEAIAKVDKNMISTVFRNLLSNAIKFSHKGSKILIVTKSFSQFHEVSVIDYGVGMSQSRIDKFMHIGLSDSTHGTDGEKGTGLGLMLCKEFVEKNNGTMKIDSKQDEGTSVTFTLLNANINNSQ